MIGLMFIPTPAVTNALYYKADLHAMSAYKWKA